MADGLAVLSVCTGVGGLDLGLERAGHRIIAQCEIDERCRAILAKHWPDVPCYEDVRDVHGEDARRGKRARARRSGVADGAHGQRRRRPGPSAVDLLCGGTPCQDLSVAGRRAGLDGDRSGLFFEFARIADELVRPGGWLLFENVPGLLSSPGGARSGRDFAIVLATLADIGFHDLAWRVLDSRYFGVPQRRRRIYIVGRRAVGDRARAVLLEPESGGGDFAPRGKAGARVAASATRGSSSPGVSAPGRQEDDINIVSALDRKGGGADDNDAQAGHLIAHTLRSHAGPGSNCSTDILCPPADADGVRAAPGISGRLDDPTGVREMTPGEDMGEAMRVFDPSGVSPRLKKQSVLTLTNAGKGTAHEPKPDGPRYAQMGNAVTVNVAHWIGLRLRAEIQ